MTLGEDKQADNDATIIVRLLNGLLRGCEFTLQEGYTLFLVAEDKMINEQHKGSLLPDNTIYIPAEHAGVNFEIVVTHDDAHKVFLREIQEFGALGRIIDPNTIITVGSQEFAWRHEHEYFADEIINRNNAPLENIEQQAPGNIPETKGGWYKLLIAVALIGALAVVGYISLTETQRQIDSVSTLLSFSPEDYQVIYGNDKSLYIFAKDDKAADWAVQTLIRNPPRQQVNVVNAVAESERIARWIETHWPLVKFHQIRLDDPRKPVIRVSAERTTLAEKDRIHVVTSLKTAFPYADNIVIEYLHDKTVRDIAEQGLKKMALAYREVNNGNSVTFVVLGVIEDGMLENIKNYVNQYYQQWGTQYVHFSVELKTDWFKDKSFKFGEQGYIKLGAGHWFFPNNPHQEK